ncbi:MAG TPA: type IV toxin-antitoxin system AbiEi family antitoxin domain-containing protein [Thermoleophilaceae bacterium]|nr:type IV toxin-antitoxin system AbiEi family antitoxin domain-containing protein [Thermoleophilaceae bacterium]
MRRRHRFRKCSRRVRGDDTAGRGATDRRPRARPVTPAQLRHLGLGASAIDHRVAAGRLHVVHRGVYAVGHPWLDRPGRRMAAALACGPGAALSHRTAADLWGLRQTAAARIDVTVPTRAGRKPRSRIRVHRAQLASAEVTMVDGIPVTTVPRTLIDFAEAVPERSVERALDEAEFLRLFDRHAIEAAIEE